MRQNFVQDICNEPFRTDIRLIFADWLMDNDEPLLGQWIKHQVETGETIAAHSGYPSLEIFHQDGGLLCLPVPFDHNGCVFANGFVMGTQWTLRRWQESGFEAVKKFPIVQITVFDGYLSKSANDDECFEALNYARAKLGYRRLTQTEIDWYCGRMRMLQKEMCSFPKPG
jgi:uncharacterized protein (TIGR02996 family)